MSERGPRKQRPVQPKPPLPILQAFLICQRILTDSRTNDCVLVAPINLIQSADFPAPFRFSVYTHWMELHGTYQLEYLLRDAHDEVLSRWRPTPITWTNRLLPYRHSLHDAHVTFPHGGKYYLELLVNDEEIARQALWVLRPGEEPG